MSAPLTVLDILPLLRRIADAPDLLNDNADFDGIGARIEDVDELRRIVREQDQIVPPLVGVLGRLETLHGMARQMRATCAPSHRRYRDGQMAGLADAIEAVKAALEEREGE